jgi:cystathionine beta-lyase
MFDFATPIDRHGTWCTQWDYVADRFGAADLLPFTISDMDFATAPCILDAVSQRLAHGVFGYSRWRTRRFSGRLPTGTPAALTASSIRNGGLRTVGYLHGGGNHPPVVEEGDGVVVHTPAYDAFYNTITANRRRIAPVPLTLKDNRWHCDMARLEAALAEPKNTLLLLCSPHNPTGKVWRREELETMAALCQKHGVRVISDEIHMDMTWGEHRHIPWSEVAQGPWALFTSGSKSFNIPAFTGAYGFIPEENERDSYLQALKGRDGLSSPPCRRWSPISPPTATGLPGSMPCATTCRRICAMSPTRSTTPSRALLAAAGGHLPGMDRPAPAQH